MEWEQVSRNSPGNFEVRGGRGYGCRDEMGMGWGIGYCWVSFELSTEGDNMGVFQSVVETLAVFREVSFDGERNTWTTS